MLKDNSYRNKRRNALKRGTSSGHCFLDQRKKDKKLSWDRGSTRHLLKSNWQPTDPKEVNIR
jgi:hypothetical protein